MANDFLNRIIGPFYQHIGPDCFNQPDGGFLVEQHNHIYAGKRRQHNRAGHLTLYRAAFAFQALDRGIGIQSNNQMITGFARLAQQGHMARMHQVKTAIGEADLLSPGAPLCRNFLRVGNIPDFCFRTASEVFDRMEALVSGSAHYRWEAYRDLVDVSAEPFTDIVAKALAARLSRFPLQPPNTLGGTVPVPAIV